MGTARGPPIHGAARETVKPRSRNVRDRPCQLTGPSVTLSTVSRLGVAVCVVAFAVLAAAAAPGLYLRDSGELTTAAFTLGVAHETGFSLYCLLGKAASLLPIGEV